MSRPSAIQDEKATMIREFCKPPRMLRYFAIALLVNALGLASALAFDYPPDAEGQPEEPNAPQEPCQNKSSAADCCKGGKKGKPISLFDGRETFSATDLSLNGHFPIALKRRYDSQATYDSPLGFGWAFLHDRKLFEYADGSVVIRSGCGVKHRFDFTGGAFQNPRDGIRADLVENPDGTFHLRNSDGSLDVYDQEGRLVLHENREGQKHEFVYVAGGKKQLVGTSNFAVDPNTPMTVAYVYQLARIQERSRDGQLTGYFVDFSYDPTTGRLQAATANDGRTISYQHDALNGLTRGNLTNVVGLEDIEQIFEYNDPNDPHNLTTIYRHANATPYINTYDSQDRVIQQDYGDHRILFDYLVDYVETRVTEIIKDDQGVVLHNAVEVFEYDEAGYLTKHTNALGHEERRIYDSNKDMTRVEFWEKQHDETLALSRARDYTYDGMGRKLTESVTLDSGEVVTRTWTYDHGWVSSEQVVSSLAPSRAFRTEWTFIRDGNNRPTNIEEVRQINDDGSYSATTYAYCSATQQANPSAECPLPGLVRTIDGPRTDVSDVTTYRYYSSTNESGCDAGGPCHQKGALKRVTNALGHAVNFLRYDRDGRLIAMSDPNGLVTQFTYDERGLMLSSTIKQPDGDLVTTNTYDGMGRKLSETLPNGQRTRFRYNGKHQLIEMLDQFDGAIRYALDSQGNQLRQQIVDASDAVTFTEKYVNDALGRRIAVEDSRGEITTMAYDQFGSTVLLTDANGVDNRRVYDELGRLVEQIDDAQGIAAVVSYAYDAAGNLTQVADPRDLVTTYQFDARSNLTTLISPDTGTTNYSYNSGNNRISQTDARGVTVGYSYDALSRLTLVDYAGSGLDITYTYDAGANGTGRLTAMSDASGSMTISYDPRGLRTGETRNIDGTSLTVGYGYDDAGLLSSITYPSGKVVTYDLDAAGRIDGVDLSGAGGNQVIADNFSHLPFGPTKGWTMGNGLSINRSYDQDYRIIALGDSILPRSYTYDPAGNITAINGTDFDADYSYDDLNRLESADTQSPLVAIQQEFGYDAVGNRLSLTATEGGNQTAENYGYPTDSNRLMSVDLVSYQYDAVGNLTADGDRQYDYDDRNRMVGVREGVVTLTSYDYNGDGERVLRTAGSVTTRFFFGLSGELLGEYGGSGNALREYVYLNGEPLAILDPAETTFAHTDHLMTPRAVTDDAGTVIWRWDSLPFGESAPSEDPDGDNEQFVFNLRFPGQYFDNESGSHYNYFRFYNPHTGRYNESDPIGLIGGVNTYLYAASNPLVSADPSGLFIRCRGWGCVFPGGVNIGRAKDELKDRLLTAAGVSSERSECETYAECVVDCLVPVALSEFATASAVNAMKEIAKKLADQYAVKAIARVGAWSYPITAYQAASCTWKCVDK